MANLSKLKIIEQCQVSPPPNSPQTSHLPLTFLDIPWLFFSPNQPLFFYEFPFPTSHFTSVTLPNLRGSLSLTLRDFYAFAGALLVRPEPEKPALVYTAGDSVSFTAVESNGDFLHLAGDHQRDAEEFYTLVPQLSSTGAHIPLLSVQITLFPNCGICIGLAYHHVVADGRTFNNFIKTWASFSRALGDGHPWFLPAESKLPSYDRAAIVDQCGLEGIFLKEWRKRISSQGILIGSTNNKKCSTSSVVVRETFVVDLAQMERIKNWIISLCNRSNEALPVHLSAYVLTCAYVWICLIKAQYKHFKFKKCGQDPNYFGFIAGGLTRLDHPVSGTYVGNCVGFGRSMAVRCELLGDNGIVVAARAIGGTVKKLDKAMLGGAEKWISDWEVMFGSELHVMASGSPKVDLYKTDFGLGRPKKIEEAGIEAKNAISLTESRDVSGGIEIGLVLPKPQMDYFTTFFNEGLNAIP